MRRETAEGRRREREAAYLMERERERDWRRRRKPTRKSNWTNVKIIDAQDATRRERRTRQRGANSAKEIQETVTLCV